MITSSRAAAAGSEISDDLSWTLKSAAGLLPAAQRVLRVHGVAGSCGMVSLSQLAQLPYVPGCAAV